MEYNPNEQEKEAINLVQNEINNWGEGEVWVTDKVAFIMKNVVKKARKNFFGIFDVERDAVTGRKKLWIPLTEWLVEGIVKNVDIDSKDIRVKAKNPDAYGIAGIFRYVLAHYIDKIYFGKLINNIIRLLAIDGTCFVKSWKEGNELKSKVIDRLNIIVDPSANSLKDTPITEKNFISMPDFILEAKSGKWANEQFAKGMTGIDRTGFDAIGTGTNASEIPMIDVYERYGWMDKFILTGNETDRGEYVYGLIVISGINERPVVHKIKKVETQPYTMFRLKEIWNRLDGRGIAEMVFSLQAYINEIVNTRLNTARVAQLGLFKLRGGVTPQQFAKLFSTSAIKLKSTRDDIERLDTGTVDPSSYRDEDVARKWGVDVTGALDESEVTASTPATNALVQERGSKLSYSMIQEGIGFSIEELIEEHYIPIIKKIVKPGDIVRITGNSADFERMDEQYIMSKVNQKAIDMRNKGEIVTPEMALYEVERIKTKLKEMGEDRFLEINDNAFDTDFNIDVQVGDEQLNSALIAQQLTQALGIAAQFPGSRIMVDQVLKEIFDTMGLDGDRLIQAQEAIGNPQAELEQQKQVGKVQAEAQMNPTPNSRPVV